MAQTRPLQDLLADSADAEVSIKIYLPDGTVTVIEDPEDHNVSNGGLWVRTADRELIFNDIPFYVSDKREKKRKTGFI